MFLGEQGLQATIYGPPETLLQWLLEVTIFKDSTLKYKVKQIRGLSMVLSGALGIDRYFFWFSQSRKKVQRTPGGKEIVCVCVREREREREGEASNFSVGLSGCVCALLLSANPEEN